MTMTYIIRRVKVETGARQKLTSEQNFKNPTNTLPLKSHINNFCTTNFLTKNLNFPGIKGLDLMRFIILRLIEHIFQACLHYLSQWQSRKLTVTRYQTLTCCDPCHISYHSTGRLHTHRCGYVTISHVGGGCGIISRTCCSLQDITDQYIFLVILVAVTNELTNEHKKHCQYEYT
jgi:hypothetical protein